MVHLAYQLVASRVVFHINIVAARWNWVSCCAAAAICEAVVQLLPSRAEYLNGYNRSATKATDGNAAIARCNADISAVRRTVVATATAVRVNRQADDVRFYENIAASPAHAAQVASIGGYIARLK